MSLPAIRALKKKFPATDIYIATKQYLSDIYLNIDEIKEIIPLENQSNLKTLFKTASKLRTFGFKEGILLTNSFHSAFLFRLAGISFLTGYDKDLRGFLLRTKKPFPRDNRHYIDFYMDIAAMYCDAKGIEKWNKTDYYSNHPVITEEEKNRIENLLVSFGIDSKKPLIGISPTAAYGTAKAWLPERFSSLIEKIITSGQLPGVQVLLLGSAGERERISKISEPFEGKKQVFNLAGLMTLRQSMCTISICSAFIGNDSGLMHIASGMAKPVVALFGPTPPEKSKPFHQDSRVLHHKVNCAPCKDRDCHLDHACMKAISVDEVFDALLSMLPISAPPLSLQQTGESIESIDKRDLS